MTAFDDFCLEFEAQRDRLNKSNLLWKKILARLRHLYWKDPKIKDAIRECEQSIIDY